MKFKPDDYFSIRQPGKRMHDMQKRSICMVEGEDEGWLIGSLLADMNINPENITVMPMDTKTAIKSSLESMIKTAAYKTHIKKFAILVDADDSHQDTLSHINKILSEQNLPSTDHDKFSYTKDKKMVGIYIIPGDGDGNLEKMCFDTIPDKKHSDLVKQFLSDVELAFDGKCFDALHKRLTGIFLETCYGKRCHGVGRAFRLGRFDQSHKYFENLRSFLSRLAEEPNAAFMAAM